MHDNIVKKGVEKAATMRAKMEILINYILRTHKCALRCKKRFCTNECMHVNLENKVLTQIFQFL